MVAACEQTLPVGTELGKQFAFEFNLTNNSLGLSPRKLHFCAVSLAGPMQTP